MSDLIKYLVLRDYIIPITIAVIVIVWYLILALVNSIKHKRRR